MKNKTYINESQLRRIIRQELLREGAEDNIYTMPRPSASSTTSTSIEDVIQYYDENPYEWATDRAKWKYCSTPNMMSSKRDRQDLFAKWGPIVDDRLACITVLDALDQPLDAPSTMTGDAQRASFGNYTRMWRGGPIVQTPDAIRRGLEQHPRRRS